MIAAAQAGADVYVQKQIGEEFIASQKGAPLNLIREISRIDLESWIRPLLESTHTAIDHALQDARLAPDKVQKVLLVGGSTRIPLVWRPIRWACARKAEWSG